jgi:CHAP domain.
LSDIRPGSIAVFGSDSTGLYGHVVFIEGVEGDNVTISEFNYNIRHGYDCITLTKEQFYRRSYGSLKGYIYIK